MLWIGHAQVSVIVGLTFFTIIALSVVSTIVAYAAAHVVRLPIKSFIKMATSRMIIALALLASVFAIHPWAIIVKWRAFLAIVAKCVVLANALAMHHHAEQARVILGTTYALALFAVTIAKAATKHP